MTALDINTLVKILSREGKVERIETHISWVIMTEDYVYKFKKPIRYSFLNYSKLPRRKYYCEREVELNSRYSDIYLGVIPVCRSDQGIRLGEQGEIIDYAVKMCRIANGFQMDNMLREGLVKPSDIVKLAMKVVGFHCHAGIIRSGFPPREMGHLFNDIRTIKPFLFQELGLSADQQINEAILDSNHFVNSHINLFQNRERYGFVRDLHGDLHTRNIFLTEDPILFDCVEFNDQYRQIDTLNEISFLIMDLEARGHEDFAREFLKTYLSIFPVISSVKEERLFAFYKCYRANVRAKVNALRAKQAKTDEERQSFLKTVAVYLDLMTRYTYDFNGVSHMNTSSDVLEYSQLSA